jgi:hypothetical protein
VLPRVDFLLDFVQLMCEIVRRERVAFCAGVSELFELPVVVCFQFACCNWVVWVLRHRVMSCRVVNSPSRNWGVSKSRRSTASLLSGNRTGDIATCQYRRYVAFLSCYVYAD